MSMCNCNQGRLPCTCQNIDYQDLANERAKRIAELKGENDRLRAEAGMHKLAMDAACGEIETLRAKLAERDALLARIVNSGALSSEHHEDLEADCCATVDVVHQIKRQAFREHLEKCAALSASTEPINPCKHEWDADGQCLFMCVKCGAETDCPRCVDKCSCGDDS